jgi:hypothetical protein
MGRGRRVIHRPVWLAVILLLGAGVPAASPQTPPSLVPLPGSTIALPHGAQKISISGAGRRPMVITVVLRRADEQGFRTFTTRSATRSLRNFDTISLRKR